MRLEFPSFIEHTGCPLSYPFTPYYWENLLIMCRNGETKWYQLSSSSG